LIIRPLNADNLIYKYTTVELFRNGNLKFLFPLNEFSPKNIPKRYLNSNTINYLLKKYCPYESNTGFANYIKLIDGTEFILNILVIIAKYKAVLEDNKFDFEIKVGFRARVTDYWRKFIFFDNDDYLEKLKLYNIPISPKNEIEIPEFRDGRYYETNLSDDHAFFQIARFILEGIGLPDCRTISFTEIFEKRLKDLANYK